MQRKRQGARQSFGGKWYFSVRISASSVSKKAKPSQLVCKKTGKTLEDCLLEYGIKVKTEHEIETSL